MISERVRAIADAVLYEGYALYPYRVSSVKNRRRWMFGSLYPRDVASALGEPFRMRCACLLEATEDAGIDAVARFLRFERRSADAWEEGAVEEVRSGDLRVGDLAERPRRLCFSLGPRTARDADGVARTRSPIVGVSELSAERLGPGVYRLIVIVENLTPLAPDADPEGARLSSLGATHAIVSARGGRFVSLVDPPPHLQVAADGCRNGGAWPVLAGAPGERDLVLCSPIILPDHPAVAPESPGDLFDGTEMDEMLTLRILTMTDDEKREAAALDGRIRALLDRTHELSPPQLARLHGAVRHLGPARTALVGGREIGPGARVRLRPRGRADILDLALEGHEATVASIEQDYEDRTFVAVTVDADPGKDLGARGLPGHRFFFRPDEVELLDAGGAR